MKNNLKKILLELCRDYPVNRTNNQGFACHGQTFHIYVHRAKDRWNSDGLKLIYLTGDWDVLYEEHVYCDHKAVSAIAAMPLNDSGNISYTKALAHDNNLIQSDLPVLQIYKAMRDKIIQQEKNKNIR